MRAGPFGLKNSSEAESAILQISSFHYMAFLGIFNVLMQRDIGHIAHFGIDLSEVDAFRAKIPQVVIAGLARVLLVG